MDNAEAPHRFTDVADVDVDTVMTAFHVHSIPAPVSVALHHQWETVAAA
jgi:hypothetical protein